MNSADDLPARVFGAFRDPPVVIDELDVVVDAGDMIIQGAESEERIRSSSWAYLDCVR